MTAADITSAKKNTTVLLLVMEASSPSLLPLLKMWKEITHALWSTLQVVTNIQEESEVCPLLAQNRITKIV